MLGTCAGLHQVLWLRNMLTIFASTCCLPCKCLAEARAAIVQNVMLASGVLYYADHAANGVKASQFVTDIHNKKDLDEFINKQEAHVLTVIDVSLNNAAPCIHIFPAVLALAKNFTGYAHFARLIGDESEETQQVLRELNVNEVSLACNALTLQGSLLIIANCMWYINYFDVVVASKVMPI